MFFLSIVLISIYYLYTTRQVVHYIGKKKDKVEIFAFLLSAGFLILMGYPSLILLYYYNSQTCPNIIVKIVGAQ